MLQIIPDLPERLVGVAASGQIAAEDYEAVVIPAVEAALHKFDSIRFLYHLGCTFTGYTAGAMRDDMKQSLEHLRKWKRVAVVTNHKWVEGALRLFWFAMATPVKSFPVVKLAEVTQWVAAKDS